MNIIRKLLIGVFICSSAWLLSGCENALNDIIADQIELTAAQENDLISVEVARNSGGVMAEVLAAGSVSDSAFYGFTKTTLDTALRLQWLSYGLTMRFFKADSQEVPGYMPGEIDRIQLQNNLSGDTTVTSPSGEAASLTVNLSRSSAYTINNILSGTITLNASGSNNSSQTYDGEVLDVNVANNSVYQLLNVVISANNPGLPLSGQLNGTVAGTLSSNDIEKEISIPYTITFNGTGVVSVSVNNGERSFDLNLVEGQITP